MHKFFVDKDDVFKDKIIIRGEDVNHIKKSLRLAVGDKILVASDSYNYLCEIDRMTDIIDLNILNKEEGKSESTVDITLYQGFAKGERMDYVFQKATEVGVKNFVIVEMDRSIVKSKNDKWKKNRLDRYNSITEEAAKQCKRDIIPKVEDIISFSDMMDRLKDEKNILVPYEEETGNKIRDVLEGIDDGKINLIIGPEGGISKEEIDRLREIGARTLTLGPRILRTETAGIIAATIIMYDLGNIGVI